MHTKEELRTWLKSPEKLQKEADHICRKHYGDFVYLRGLIEFSNICTMNCLYCGIRHENTQATRYALDIVEIKDIIKKGYEEGLRTFVLQSGESNSYSVKKICEVANYAKEISNGAIAMTLSAGVKSKETFKEFKAAGFDRYLMRFETSDPKLHTYLRNGMTLARRLRALDDLKELGYEVGSGFMTGLPDETEDTFLDNVLLCQEYGFDMVGIGPFIAHPDTPLANAPDSSIELVLHATALVRLVLPMANLPATTAAGSLVPNGRELMLKWGANVLMPNISPISHKKDYLLYPGKICLDESGFECIGCLSNRVATVGKQIWPVGHM